MSIAAKLPERDRRLVESLPKEIQGIAVELWEHAERNSRTPSVLSEDARERKRKWIESLTHLERVCTRALNGDLGSENRETARRMLLDADGNRLTDEQTMRRAVAKFRKHR